MVMQKISIEADKWPEGLHDARAKLQRAKEHADALQGGVDAYLEGQPFQLVPTFEPELRCHVVRLRVDEEPPLRLGAIVGDLAHNLRSALDSITWRLAVAHVGIDTAVRNRSAIDFPITETPSQFAKDRVLPFVSDDARTVLERVQPYNRRFMNTEDAPLSADPLILVRDLSNIDKHRALHPAFVDLSGMVTFPGVRKPHDVKRVIVESNLEPGGRIEDGAEISRVTFPPDIPPEDTDLKLGQPTLQVTFGNGANPDNLTQTTYMIAAVVQDFSEIIAAS
jgi:hypothetical protein